MSVHILNCFSMLADYMRSYRASEEIHKYRVQARLLPQVVHPFMDPFQTLTFGLHHGMPDSTDSEDDIPDDTAEEEATRAR